MQMMADALWDKECDFEEKSDEYFLSAFGNDGFAVKEYLKNLSTLIDFEYLRFYNQGWDEAEQAKKFRMALASVFEFESVIKRNLKETDGNLKASWKYLELHAEFLKLFIPALIRRAEGADDAELDKLALKVADFIALNDSKLHRTLDTFYYYHMSLCAIKKL